MRNQTKYDIAAELKAARKKFPNPEHLFAALTEEVGELAKALLDEPAQAVYDEAKQVATMAIRIMEEGDPTFDALRARRALGRSQAMGYLG